MKFEVTIDITGAGHIPLAISRQEFCAMTDKITFIHHVPSGATCEWYLKKLSASVDSLIIMLLPDAPHTAENCNTVGYAIKSIAQDLLTVDCKQPIDFRQRVEMSENAAVELIVKELV